MTAQLLQDYCIRHLGPPSYHFHFYSVSPYQVFGDCDCVRSSPLVALDVVSFSNILLVLTVTIQVDLKKKTYIFSKCYLFLDRWPMS